MDQRHPTQIQKRLSLKWAMASAIGALALSACGKQEPPAASTPAPAPAAQAPATPAADKPLKVAFAYIGPVGDGGWTFAHDTARKKMQEAVGDKVEVSFVESVPESADAERIFRGFATDGNSMVFGTSFGYMESMVRVAEEFPNVKFEHATGYKTAANLSSYDSRTYEGAYMAGIIAGGMTKSNVLGIVGSVPIPEVIRNINSFTLGAQSVNPNITTKIVWVNEWFNPPKETEAATSLINNGADILFQNTDSPAVLKTAQELGKRAFGWDSDMTAYGPKAHLASAIIDWSPYYIDTVKSALDNKWTSRHTWWGVKEGTIDIVSLADDIPQEIKDRVNTVRAGLQDGTYNIWKGPITGQDGSVILADGVVGDDQFLSGVNFYIKGVEGKVPGSK